MPLIFSKTNRNVLTINIKLKIALLRFFRKFEKLTKDNKVRVFNIYQDMSVNQWICAKNEFLESVKSLLM